MRSLFPGAVVVLFLATSTLARQTDAPKLPGTVTPAQQTEAAVRMSGVWHLNTDSSTGLPNENDTSGTGAPPPAGPPGGSGRGGGGFGGGGGGGGGFGGGRGGGGFGGGASGGASS